MTDGALNPDDHQTASHIAVSKCSMQELHHLLDSMTEQLTQVEHSIARIYNLLVFYDIVYTNLQKHSPSEVSELLSDIEIKINRSSSAPSVLDDLQQTLRQCLAIRQRIQALIFSPEP